MNNYDVKVDISGIEYYTVEANSEEEAIQKIKEGDGYLQSSEVGFTGYFSVYDVTPILGDEDDD